MRIKQPEIKKGTQHLKKDPILSLLIKKHGLWSPKISKNIYQDLVESVINQQLSDKASATIISRFIGYFGGKFPKPEVVLKTADEKIRKIGISWSKVKYIKEISLHAVNKKLEFTDLINMEDKEIRKQLDQIKGVGPWTVDMILIFSLVRLDILPVGDLGIRRAMEKLYKKQNIKLSAMEKIATPWRPYRSIASWYLWRSLG